jgi:hypothetical protein
MCLWGTHTRIMINRQTTAADMETSLIYIRRNRQRTADRLAVYHSPKISSERPSLFRLGICTQGSRALPHEQVFYIHHFFPSWLSVVSEDSRDMSRNDIRVDFLTCCYMPVYTNPVLCMCRQQWDASCISKRWIIQTCVCFTDRVHRNKRLMIDLMQDLLSWRKSMVSRQNTKRNLLSLSRTKDLLMTINNYSQTL